MPRPTQVDQAGRILSYNDSHFLARVVPILETWRSEPGDEKLSFIFPLSGMYELGIERDDIRFPGKQWKSVFAQWLDHFKAVVKQAGIADDRWMLVLRDESS